MLITVSSNLQLQLLLYKLCICLNQQRDKSVFNMDSQVCLSLDFQPGPTIKAKEKNQYIDQRMSDGVILTK